MNQDTVELLKRIEMGEDSVFELKRLEFEGSKVKSPHRNSMADELAAMANSSHGTVVLGVDDDSREIIGIPLDNLDATEAWIRNIANDLIDPPLDCVIRKVLVEIEGVEKYLVRVDVPRSLFVHKSPNGYFRRIGSSKRELKPDALARLFQQRSQARIIRFDEQAVPGTGVDTLKPELWQRFRGVLSSKDDLEFLQKMKLIVSTDEGVSRASVSGVLMASEEPHQHLPNAFIQAVLYRGTERHAAKQLDAKDIVGPLDVQIKEACKFVERNTRVYAIKAPNRIEIPQYSMNAVFEAVVNAVAHRDYAIYASKIRLHVFSDRLEIYSPGSIPNTMTIESLSERQAARNELITSLLARCPMNVEVHGTQRSYIMDKRGEGVPIIISESEALSGRRPVFELIDDAELKLTIWGAEPPEVND